MIEIVEITNTQNANTKKVDYVDESLNWAIKILTFFGVILFGLIMVFVIGCSTIPTPELIDHEHDGMNYCELDSTWYNTIVFDGICK